MISLKAKSMQDMFPNIITSIKKGAPLPPFLFLWHNNDLLNSKVHNLAQQVLQDLEIPESYLYTLEDTGENIKIQEIKRFLEPSFSRPPYPVQIFCIENISRLTLSAGNSMLKFLEEPWKQNIILLSNGSESGILETILSRVNIQYTGIDTPVVRDNFFYSLIDDALNKKDMGIYGYFFQTKLESSDAVVFLKTLLEYHKNTGKLWAIIESIDDDIHVIEQNNANGKYIVDKYLMMLG